MSEVDSTSYISVTPRVIFEFGGVGPEALDHGTPVIVRTRRSTLFIQVSFSADPGNYEWGIAQSNDGINYTNLEASITGSGPNPVLKTYRNFTGAFIQPFQTSKDNDVVMTLTARSV